MAASQSPSSFDGIHRWHALRVYKTGVMSNSSTGERSPAVAASRSLRALRAAVSRPGGVLAPGYQHGAVRIVLAGDHRPDVWCLLPPKLYLDLPQG